VRATTKPLQIVTAQHTCQKVAAYLSKNPCKTGLIWQQENAGQTAEDGMSERAAFANERTRMAMVVAMHEPLEPRAMINFDMKTP